MILWFKAMNHLVKKVTGWSFSYKVDAEGLWIQSKRSFAHFSFIVDMLIIHTLFIISCSPSLMHLFKSTFSCFASAENSWGADFVFASAAPQSLHLDFIGNYRIAMRKSQFMHQVQTSVQILVNSPSAEQISSVMVLNRLLLARKLVVLFFDFCFAYSCLGFVEKTDGEKSQCRKYAYGI